MRILVGILDMGLGHATRALPVLRYLVQQGHEVIVGSGGRALALVRKELPEVPTVELPGYGLRYARGQATALKLVCQIPAFLQAVRREHILCKHLVRRFRPDVIFSNHCYGMYHPEVYSLLLIHQVYFELPEMVRFLRRPAGCVHRMLYRGFHRILIPDYPSEDGGRLTGRLSECPVGDSRYAYMGILSSLPKSQFDGDPIDVLISVSGPEPQRTIFERIVLEQSARLDGRVVVVLGKPEEDTCYTEGSLTVYSHVSRREMAGLMQRARCIVSRSGYSTVMELVELGKKALLVPTPGQTEQEYLARRFLEKGWFYAVPQAHLMLSRDLARACTFPGLHIPYATAATVRRVCRYITRPYAAG